MGIETAVLIGGLVASLATAGVGIAGAMKEPPKSPALPADKTDEQLTSEIRTNEAERKRAARAQQGIGSTILTSPLGVEEDVNMSTPSLLGY